uniref:Uncharacterized protein n=1 Tax=Glossina morsitans morsitans TaxID=37546 RepID=A0A1B0FQZ9_GLOMM
MNRLNQLLISKPLFSHLCYGYLSTPIRVVKSCFVFLIMNLPP